MKSISRPCSVAVSMLCGLSFITASGQVNITTWQANLQHTGANLQETILTPQAVSTPGNFGLLFTQPLDGQTYGQPLFVSSGTLGKFADGSLHNVVYVATQHDSVYAFDGDNANGGPLWHVSLLPAGTTPVPQADTNSGDIQIEVGITTTPVIDPIASTLFVVSKVKTTSNGTYQQYLHALDLKTGADKISPVLINPTFAGNAMDAVNGVIPFNALREHERCAMILYQGVVYLSYASHGDTTPYHGEILGYNAANLQLVKTFISSPNGQFGGFWMSGAGPAVDASGNLFTVSGNGPFDQTASQGAAGNDWGNAMLKLPTNTTGVITLPITSTSNFYLPPNWVQLGNGDNDIGAGGLLLLPDQTGGAHPHLMMGGGKNSLFYVLDRDNLGGSSATDMAVQEIAETAGHEILITPAYFNQNIYYAVAGQPLTQRAVGFDASTGHYISTNPISSAGTYSGTGQTVFISATPQNTNGLVWILRGNGLDVYNATNVSGQPIFTENATVPSGNISCQNTKFSSPMVANGKAYYTAYDSTNTGHLFVSGLKAAAGGTPAAPSNLNVVANSSASITLSWTSNSTNETSFQISRSSPGSALAPYHTVGAGVTSFTDIGLTANTQYSYQVQAVNASGSSSGTTIQSATTFPLFTSAGLVAYWTLDDGVSATQAADDTGNGHTGTISSGVNSVTGFINGAYSFHGVGTGVSYISVANAADLQFNASQSFTLSAWVNPANLNRTEQAIVAKSADQGNAYGIFINSANAWVFRGSSGDIIGPTASQNVWTQVTAVQNGSTGKRTLYVNGSAVATGNAQAADGAGALWMGQQNSSNPDSFPGIIDEVRVYNIALTPGGVTDGLAPPVLSAVSNLTQGGSGTFGITLLPSIIPVSESRKGSNPGNYSIALTFSAPVSGVAASLALQNGGGAVGSIGSVNSDSTHKFITVALSGVSNQQALNLHLSGIQPGNGTADIPFNVLWGDVNSDSVVDSHDLTIVQKSFNGQVTQATAAYDINGDGIVNAADASLVSGAIGTKTGSQTDSNLALFQPSSASSILGGNTSDMAFDNDVVLSRWESVQGVDPQWLQVDLGTTAGIHAIQLNWENAAGKNYTFATSPNGKDTFTPLGPAVVGNVTAGIKTYTGLNGSGRFVRITGTVRDSPYGYSLIDFKVIGIPGSGSGTTPTAPAITSALSASGTVGSPFNYQIAASQNPNSYGETGTLPAGLTLNTATGAITGTPTTVGTSSVTITATNAVGTGSATLTFTISAATTTGTVIYQINAGGGAVAPYVADEFSSASATANTGSAITVNAADPTPMAVYQSERYGNSFTYTLPGLTAGKSYTVRLHFAEIYFSNVNQRVFNVAINSTSALSSFDIVKEANGPFIGIVRSFPATPVNGQIVISFTTATQNLPKISGIELIAN